MKKTIVFFFGVLITAISYGQYFEGKITYATSYKSKSPNMTNDQFGSVFGRTQEYYIKGGNYKSVTNGAFAKWQLFINKDNKLYNKINNDTIFWNDVTEYNDPIIKVEVNKGVTEVLGYLCDEFILTSNSGVQKYYFSTKLGVDTKLYSKHAYSHWYTYLQRTNSLPLKMIIDTKQVNYSSVATEVKPMKLEDSIFTLPANSKTKRSPY